MASILVHQIGIIRGEIDVRRPDEGRKARNLNLPAARPAGAEPTQLAVGATVDREAWSHDQL